jgi:hypothetical protein
LIHPDFLRQEFFCVNSNRGGDLGRPQDMTDDQLCLLRWNERIVASVLNSRCPANFHDIVYSEFVIDALRNYNDFKTKYH